MLDLLIKGGTVVDGTGEVPLIHDVGIRNGKIAEVGIIDTPAHRTIDAQSLIVTPGFIDIHTHYDGQATWDSQLDPSFSAGVTTAIIGNCGVGFAPVRPGDEQRLVDLMEGVEEIPGTALHEGLRWNWSSFTEYLDVLDTPRSFDIGALLPHGPLRRYVLGDKVGTNKCASGEELAAMAAMVDDAMSAGAFGLSSSRTPIHRTISGDMTDDFDVDEPELLALAAVVARHDGFIEFAPLGSEGIDRASLRNEMRMYERIIDRTGANMHLLVVQTNDYPDECFEQIKWAEAINHKGRSLVHAQIAGRSVAALLSFYGINPFMDRKTLVAIKREFPREEWIAQLAKPEVKAAILADESIAGSFGDFINRSADRCFDLGPEVDYEPDESRSITGMARLQGRDTMDLLYDLMIETSDAPRILIAIQNYIHGSLDDVARMMTSSATVLSLSDAGAHVQSLCDGSIHPFMLTHWVRDRRRGQRIPIQSMVRKMTRDSAIAVNLHDRGIIAPGFKADINIIDLDALTLRPPRFVDDLPAGAMRLMQDVSGFRATIVSGVVTREFDRATGALPGGLLRHGQRTADLPQQSPENP